MQLVHRADMRGLEGTKGPECAADPACTEQRARWTAVNACLPPALALDGQEIITAEGLGTPAGVGTAEDLHPVQREMATRGGSQCGYCTPGFVCAMAAEIGRAPCRERVGR